MTPEGWSLKSLGSVLERVAKPVVPEPKRFYREIGIRSHGKGIFHKKPVCGESLGDKRVFEVVPDCLVLNIVFAWEQAVAKTTPAEIGMIASHRFPMYRPKPDACDVDYLTYFFKSKRGKSLLELASPGGAGRNKTLGQDEFSKLEILMPSVAEQRRIADTLAIWDKAIGVADLLLANNQALRKSLVQKVLTGDMRLKGFSGPWVQHSIADVARVIVSNVDKKTIPGQAKIRLCNYMDVYHNRYITDDMTFMPATSTEREIRRFALVKGDVVITKDSESPDDIAVPSLVRTELNGVICGYHLAIIRPNRNLVDGSFLACLLSMPKTRHFFFRLANGATRFGLPVRCIESAQFSFPKLDEQKAIAALFASIDDEIGNVTSQRAALVSQRTALMQQLLNGRRRVKINATG